VRSVLCPRRWRGLSACVRLPHCGLRWLAVVLRAVVVSRRARPRLERPLGRVRQTRGVPIASIRDDDLRLAVSTVALANTLTLVPICSLCLLE
jgi:hypothetical protein